MGASEDLALSALRGKYERLRALREAHTRAKDDARFIEPDPRRAMAALAEEFPGALRELDMLPLDAITRRIEALARAEHDAAAVEPWMRAQIAYHRLARGALATKRWLAGRRGITEEVRVAFAASLPTIPRGDDARAFVTVLERVAAPPRGRLLDLVLELVAAELGIDPDEARALLRVPRPSARG